MLYRIVIGVYGLINIAGGLFAYLSPKIQSVWSLIIGGIAGALFLIFSTLPNKNNAFAMRASAALCGALTVFWIFRINELSQQGKPATMAIMNLGLALGVFLVLGAGHMLAGRKRNS